MNIDLSVLKPMIEALVNPYTICVLAVLGFVWLVQMVYYLYFFTGIIARNRAEKKQRISFAEEQPPVSIVICARNEDENLRNYLPLVLQQDYPNYEVIVVNDGSTDDTVEVLEELQGMFPHLRYTSIERKPSSNKYPISPKKMAVTMGVKSAQHELLLFTDADCRPASPHWLSLMVRNYSPNTEFVLGYGSYFAEKGFVSRLVSYDTLFIAIQSLGFAYRGVPYMGVGRNMSYRSTTFFRLNGFAGHLHIASGDDDLIVNKAANSYNTQIEVNAQAKTYSNPSESYKEWFQQKRRHLTASELYSKSSKFLLGLEPLTRGLFVLGIIASVFTFNPLAWGIVGLLAILRWLVQVIVINRCASILDERKFIFSIPFFDLFLPLVSLYLMTIDRSFGNHKKNSWG